jgi:hypothetical protein
LELKCAALCRNNLRDRRPLFHPNEITAGTVNLGQALPKMVEVDQIPQCIRRRISRRDQRWKKEQ